LLFVRQTLFQSTTRATLRPGGAGSLKKWLALLLLLPVPAAQADYPNTILSFQPVAYWRLDETNVPAADSAVNLGTLGQPGTGYYRSGATHPVAGALAGSTNAAAAFDGVSGLVAVPYSSALSMPAPFTIEAWVRPEQVPPATDPSAVLACVSFFGSGRLGWVIYQSGDKWNLRLGDTLSWVFDESGTNVIQAGVWHHLAALYDGTNATLRVNGTVDLSGPVASYTPNNAAPFEIGGVSGPSRYNNAAVDEVAIYTNVLSAADILAHYQNGTNVSPSVSYDQLVLTNYPAMYFRLDEPEYVPGPSPEAVNSGSLGTNATGFYQPGSLPGVGGVSYTGLGAGNRACRFNGMQAHVNLGTSDGLNIQGPMTLIAWIKSDPAVSRLQCLVGRGDYSWRLTMTEDGEPAFANGPYNPVVVGTNSVNDGKWHQLAGVYDGESLSLYVDGVPNTTSGAYWPVEGSMDFAAIGGAPDYPDRFFAGSVDEVAVFTNALTPAQIMQIYESANVPPAFTHTPLSQEVIEGLSVTLDSAAVGTSPLSWQWTRNGATLPGQTAATLTLTNVTAADAGSYAVEVSNAFGVAVSPPAVVTIQPGPPILYSQPQSLARYAGGTASFSVSAGGTLPLAYQWYFNGDPIPGATASNYALPSLHSTNDGAYYCIITNALGRQDSYTAFLAVIPAPAGFYAARVLADGPMAFWRLGETGGTTAYDYVGGFNGLYTNVVMGRPGYSLLDLDTAMAFGPIHNSYVGGIEGIDFGAAGSNTAFSVEAWVRCPFGQGGNFALRNLDACIVAKGPAGAEQFSLDLGADGYYRFLIRETGGQAREARSSSAPDNTWQHVVGVCDGSAGQLSLYVDGEPQASAAFSAGVLGSSHSVSIGSRQSGTSAYDLNLNGLVDEVAIYSRALSGPEVAAHFNARCGTNSAPYIGAHPEPVTNFVSLPVTFRVQAAGTKPLSYRWQFNDSDIPGAPDSNTFTIASLHATNAGNYSVVVSNAYGVSYSAPAALTVWPVPTAVDLTSELVLHLKFDGDGLDWSGRGHHGVSVGATSFVAGRVGSNALHYASDGGSSFNYIALGLLPDLQFSSNVDFSVACWIRLPEGAAPDDLPFFGNAVGSSFQPGFNLAPGRNPYSQAPTGGWQWTLVDANGNGVWSPGAPGSINDGNWHHLAHTFNRFGNAITYLDGVRVDSRTIGYFQGFSIGDLDTGEPVNIGQDPTGAYTGAAAVDMDDLGVWRRILTPLEVAAIYAVGANHGASFGTVPFSIAYAKVSGQIQITWTVGILQCADELTGPYVDLPAAMSPYLVTPSEPQKFYRVRQ
jgi:hypothetical protein